MRRCCSTAPDTLVAGVREEIRRLLGEDGTVYLLGGQQALSAAVEQSLRDEGWTVIRVAGPSRVETALAVADLAGQLDGSPATAALARADAPADNPTAAWADSVTSGAWAASTGSPILLTPTAELHPAVATWLSAHPTTRPVVVGGTAAVSAAVQQEAGADVRVDGPNRFATASAIAGALWADEPAGYLVANGTDERGWAFALPAAGLAADLGRPMLLVERDRLPAETDATICQGTARAALTLVGGSSLIGPQVRGALDGPCPSG